MLKDLKSDISRWINREEYIILVIDLNWHILESKEAESLRSMGLYKSITDRYQEFSLEPTHQCGTFPIDGIFISSSLLIMTGEYLSFEYVYSDHRALWIKLKISMAFSYILHQIPNRKIQ